MKQPNVFDVEPPLLPVRSTAVESASHGNHTRRSVRLSSPAERAPGNTPSDVSGFVGREAELGRLRQLLADTRLVTLVGPGGVGKTRLALGLAADLDDAFADGTWLVDLSPISDPSLVPQAVGDVLGVRQQPGRSWLEALTRALRSRRLLVVLDNCEHLINACGALVDVVLRECPHVHVLATSVQPLASEGETTWRVPPLSLPPGPSSELDDLQGSEAVRLFVARVRSHLPTFTLNARNADLIADICRRLDGLPLALELVAARVEGLGLVEISARLNDRFRLAVGGRRTAPARQRTLLAALEWTCGLLDKAETVLLRRLGVFVGGWTLAAAEAVCAGEELAEDAVADVLERLVTKSLVVADHMDLSVRYRLLETVRAYALSQLAAAVETEPLHHRHMAYLVQLAERTEPLSLARLDAALLEDEHDNVRAALEWALERGQADTGLRLASAVHPLWVYTGHYAEGRAWLERLLSLPDAGAATSARADALTSDGQLLLLGGDFASARMRVQAALEAYQADGDTRGIGFSLQVLGDAALQSGDLAQASALHTRALHYLREANSPGVVLSLVQIAVVACEVGDAERARSCIAEYEAIGRARGDQYALASGLYERGLVATVEGDAAVADRFFEESLARTMNYQQGIVVILTSLGHTRLDQQQREPALAAFREAVDLARVSGERHRLLRALEGVARGLATSDPDAAVRLAGATDRQRQAIGAVAFPSERRYLERWLADARRALGSTAYQRAWEDGHASTLDQAVGLAEAMIHARTAAANDGLLSPREAEVAVLLARGLTNKQIASELVVSPGTIRSHVEHILAKLDLTSRAQVAVWASRQGLVPESTEG
jgi:predicted ATPase/DNA-binding NarL/FixJ family response regulator